MSKVFVVANGESRKGYDLNKLKVKVEYMVVMPYIEILHQMF